MRLATSRFLGRPNNFVVNGYAREERERRASRGATGRMASRRTIRTTGSTRRSSYREIQENFRPALGFVQRDNVRLFRVAGSYNPRPKNFLNVQQMFHDVYYTRFTRLDNGEVESWDLYVTLLDWHLKSGDNLHGMFDFNPTYERLFEPFEISPGRVPAARRVPLHPLQEQPAVDGHQAAAVGQRQSDLRRLLVRQSRAGDDEPDLQASAALHRHRQHEPDVCAAAGRRLHRPDLHVAT